jgi:hypothetical protein
MDEYIGLQAGGSTIAYTVDHDNGTVECYSEGGTLLQTVTGHFPTPNIERRTTR